MSDISDRLNAALDGRYHIERELGQGGMATVYLAEDLKHKRKVALKVLKPELAAVLGGERFVQEITTTASLQHPHILPLFDSGTADGFLFYVMPYIEGETLREKLDREAQLGIDEAVRITREVADALDYAHRQGIIHRDIKPENILLHDGRPMVADFGIALAVSAAAGGRMTETGTSVGTPHYMSPEQATADREITGRADQYSLASVLYEMLAGEPPHTGGTAQAVIMKIIADTPRPVADLRKSVPPNVAAAVMKALEKLPADRFGSSKAFADALADPAFRNVGGAASAGAGRRTRSARTAAGMVALIAAVLVAGWWLGSRQAGTGGEVARTSIMLAGGDDLAGSRANDVCCNRQRPSLTALAMSPDGSTLVFAGNRNGVRQLFRRPIGEARAIPIEGTEDAEYPVFSPNGETLLFWSAGWLRTIPLEGGTAVQLVEVGDMRGASWGDDGRIVFRDGAINGLRRVDASSGPVESLGSAPDADLPQVLPGSEFVLYTMSTGSDETGLSIESLRLRDGARDTVIANAADARYAETGHLVFARVGQLMAVPFDLSQAKTTGAPVGILADVMQAVGGTNTYVRTAATQYAISGGGHLAFMPGSTTRPFTFRVALLDRRGAVTDLGFPGRFYLTARFSPDGGRVAVSAPGPSAPGLWLADTDGPANIRRLVTGSAPWVAWSPEGSRVVYWHDGGLATIATRGGFSPEPLYPGGDPTPAFWTEDDGIVFLALDSTGTFVLRAVSETTPQHRTILADPGGSIMYPALSQDSRWLAYLFDRTGAWRDRELVLRSWPSGEDRRVIATGAISGVAWGPAGELLYTDEREYPADPHMMSIRIDASTGSASSPRELFATTVGGAAPVRSWDVSADGQRFLALRLDEDNAAGEPPAGEIHLVLNWFRELEAMR